MSTTLGWLGSSVVRLERIEPSINVRIIARKTASGSIEFGLQWAVPGTSWGEQIFPSLRFFPDVDHTRWLNSSAIRIGPATAATVGDSPTRVLSAFTRSNDGTGVRPAVTRYRLLAGERYAFSFGDRTTPTLAGALLERRSSTNFASSTTSKPATARCSSSPAGWN